MPAPTTIQKLQYIHQFACRNAPDLSFAFWMVPDGIKLRAWGDSRRPIQERLITYTEIESATKAAIEQAILTTFEAARKDAQKAQNTPDAQKTT